MSPSLLMLAVLSPLFAAVLYSRWPSQICLLLAPLPALAVGLLSADVRLALPWLLLGTELQLDSHNRLFLTAAAWVWFAAALYCLRLPQAATQSRSFSLFTLLAMSGNFLLILSHDAVSFYLGFTLMGLSSYPLIRASLSRLAQRAAAYYLMMTLLSEVLLFVGLVSLVADAGSHYLSQLAKAQISGLSLSLLLLAAAIKGALFGLHGWLIAAHSSAPYPASAVMSGLMVKAGVLIAFKFLPLGEVTLAGAGQVLLLLGTVGAVLGLLLALFQTQPKVLLAWSTMGKMGVLFCAIGLMLRQPQLVAGLLPALALYACAHSLIKSSLFLNLGLLRQRHLPAWLAVLPLLLFIGVPFSAADVAKTALIEPTAASSYATQLYLLLAVTGVLTVLAVYRFYLLQSAMLHSAIRQSVSQPGFAAEQLLDWLPVALLLGGSLLLSASAGVEFKFSNLLPLAVAVVLLLVGRARLAKLGQATTSGMLPLLWLKRLLRVLGNRFHRELPRYKLQPSWWQYALLNQQQSIFPAVLSLVFLLLLLLALWAG